MKTKKIGVRVEKELLAKIEEEGEKTSKVVRKALKQYFSRRSGEQLLDKVKEGEIIKEIDPTTQAILGKIEESIGAVREELKSTLERQEKRIETLEDLGKILSMSQLSWWTKRKWHKEFKRYLIEGNVRKKVSKHD